MSRKTRQVTNKWHFCGWTNGRTKPLINRIQGWKDKNKIIFHGVCNLVTSGFLTSCLYFFFCFSFLFSTPLGETQPCSIYISVIFFLPRSFGKEPFFVARLRVRSPPMNGREEIVDAIDPKSRKIMKEWMNN